MKMTSNTKITKKWRRDDPKNEGKNKTKYRDKKEDNPKKKDDPRNEDAIMQICKYASVQVQGVSKKMGRCFAPNFSASWVTRMKGLHIF